MDNFQIETAQNVSIDQNVANLGDRILAFFVDVLIIVAFEIIMFMVLRGISAENFQKWMYYLILGLPPFLYHLIFETFHNGQSLGKAVLKIRVVKLDGSKPAFSNFAIRWLLRVIDISMSSGGVAMVVLLFNGKGQRLGDLAAGTTVISERQHIFSQEMLMVDVPEGYEPFYPQVTVFSDGDMQEIKRLFEKAKRESNHRLINQLFRKVEEIMQVSSNEKPLVFIDRIITDYNYYTQYS